MIIECNTPSQHRILSTLNEQLEEFSRLAQFFKHNALTIVNMTVIDNFHNFV
jgi:hypothetical protein